MVAGWPSWKGCTWHRHCNFPWFPHSRGSGAFAIIPTKSALAPFGNCRALPSLRASVRVE
eukprot:7288520-Prorocentrum_lima.AAC.1